MRVSDVPPLLLEPAQTRQGSTQKSTQADDKLQTHLILITLFNGEPTRNQVSNSMYMWSIVLEGSGAYKWKG